MPIDSEPSALPSTIASVAIQNDWPKNQTPMMPTKMVANSMFGDTQVQNCCRACRAGRCSGMNSAPPGSTAATLDP